MTVLLLQCMSLQLALRFISLPCSKQVAFGQKQTSNGMRSPQSRSRMTRSRPSRNYSSKQNFVPRIKRPAHRRQSTSVFVSNGLRRKHIAPLDMAFSQVRLRTCRDHDDRQRSVKQGVYSVTFSQASPLV